MSPIIDLNVSPTTSASFPNTPIESSPPTPRSSEAYFHQLGAQAMANTLAEAFPSHAPAISKMFQDQHIWGESNSYSFNAPQTTSPQSTFPSQLNRPFDGSLDGRPFSSFAPYSGTDSRSHSAFDGQHRPGPWTQLSSQFDERSNERTPFDFGKLFSDDNSKTSLFPSLPSVASREQQATNASEVCL